MNSMAHESEVRAGRETPRVSSIHSIGPHATAKTATSSTARLIPRILSRRAIPRQVRQRSGPLPHRQRNTFNASANDTAAHPASNPSCRAMAPTPPPPR